MVELDIKFDPSQKPMTLDSTIVTGDTKGETLLAIYELQGDELRVCLPAPASPDPWGFPANPEAVSHFHGEASETVARLSESPPVVHLAPAACWSRSADDLVGIIRLNELFEILGDGATIMGPLVRKRDHRLIGHVPVDVQLHGVRRRPCRGRLLRIAARRSLRQNPACTSRHVLQN